ncbi:MAG: hypothetical protein ACRDTE_10785 [Pseudonocardiaceae bacterium]
MATPHEPAAYRRYIKENHPDVGGDPDAFAVGLARVRAAFPRDTVPHPQDRYDAPVEFVDRAERMRRRIRRIWWRLRRRRGPPRVL